MLITSIIISQNHQQEAGRGRVCAVQQKTKNIILDFLSIIFLPSFVINKKEKSRNVGTFNLFTHI
jgi:hypothetical protein